MTAKDIILCHDRPSLNAPDFGVTILKCRRELDRLLPVLALSHWDLKPRPGTPSMLKALVAALDSLLVGCGIRLVRTSDMGVAGKRGGRGRDSHLCVAFVANAVGIATTESGIDTAVRDAIAGRGKSR